MSLPVGLAEEAKMQSLTKQLEEKAKGGKSDPERKKIMDDATEALRKSEIIKNAKKTGDIAPGFTLKNTHNKSMSLNDYLNNGPVCRHRPRS
jgi:hypothetical protein